MTERTRGDVAVVKQQYVLTDAYKMGHDEFQELDPLDDDSEMDLAPFKGGARWSNVITPQLRAMAGHGDSGHGTYTKDRKVALVHPGCEEDEPAEADLVDAARVYEALLRAYDTGAYDGWEGTWDPDSVLNEL